MRRHTERGEKIRTAITEAIDRHPADLVNTIAKRFGISRQAVGRYIQELVEEACIEGVGSTRARRYSLKTLDYKTFSAPLHGLEEDRLWRAETQSVLGELPRNVLDIWHYAFTEMVNNAIDHSGGTKVTAIVRRNVLLVEMRIHDDGIGIFRKIKELCNLDDERHAILELAKGRLTTDPRSHTGEGIFFTSRMLDEFAILSGNGYFSHRRESDRNWILADSGSTPGTSVIMRLGNRSKRTTKETFDRFAADPEDYGFTKTVIPVHLASYGQASIVSRSQAKRLLAGVDRFKTVVLDFDGIESVGQAFADEVFRIFVRDNPSILVLPINTCEEVQRMIARATGPAGAQAENSKAPL